MRNLFKFRLLAIFGFSAFSSLVFSTPTSGSHVQKEADLTRPVQPPYYAGPSPTLPPKKKTKTGHVFKRDYFSPALGEAWRDEDRMIWGDIVKNADGSIGYMDQYEAKEYCENLGATLPMREDFDRLRNYMGGNGSYTPQVLPNLDGNWFWSWSTLLGESRLAMYFGGRDGRLGYASRDNDGLFSVRCVLRSTTKNLLK